MNDYNYTGRTVPAEALAEVLDVLGSYYLGTLTDADELRVSKAQTVLDTAAPLGERNHDADWTLLMDAVHRLIEETGMECPEHDDDPLCHSIAVGLWLDGWKQAQPPAPGMAALLAECDVIEMGGQNFVAVPYNEIVRYLAPEGDQM